MTAVPAAARLGIVGLRAGYSRADVLHGIDLVLEPGRLTVLLGPNGAGKSTLLRCIMGLLEPREGRIDLNDAALPRNPAKVSRSGIALVPEGRRLFGPESIADNLLIGGWNSGRSRRQVLVDRATMYERFPILGSRRREAAASLSGGEAQMLAIAMALMSRPKVLLLDEPSLGLAPKIVNEVMDLAVDLTRQGVTLLLVEQMVHKALAICDYAAVLGQGRVVAQGTAAEISADPVVRATYLGVKADVGVQAPLSSDDQTDNHQTIA